MQSVVAPPRGPSDFVVSEFLGCESGAFVQLGIEYEKAIGHSDVARLVQTIHYLSRVLQGVTLDGVKWVWYSATKLRDRWFPLWSVRTLQRIIGKALTLGFLECRKNAKIHNNTTVYRVNYDRLAEALKTPTRQNVVTTHDNLSQPPMTNCHNPISEITYQQKTDQREDGEGYRPHPPVNEEDSLPPESPHPPSCAAPPSPQSWPAALMAKAKGIFSPGEEKAQSYEAYAKTKEEKYRKSQEKKPPGDKRMYSEMFHTIRDNFDPPYAWRENPHYSDLNQVGLLAATWGKDFMSIFKTIAENWQDVKDRAKMMGAWQKDPQPTLPLLLKNSEVYRVVAEELSGAGGSEEIKKKAYEDFFAKMYKK